MTHDSRRYHRTRPPAFTRRYGMLGALGGGGGGAGAAGAATAGAEAAGAGAEAGGIGSTIASGLESAATAAGPILGKVLGGNVVGLGKTAVGGLESLGQGLQSLFTGGGGEAGKLADLGQSVPAGVDLLGPSSTFTGPGFLGGVYQGFIGAPQHFANASAGTSLGQGVGQLMDAIQKLQASGGGPAKMPQIVTPAPSGVRPIQVIPGGTGMESRAQAPIMSLLHI